VLEAISKLKL